MYAVMHIGPCPIFHGSLNIESAGFLFAFSSVLKSPNGIEPSNLLHMNIWKKSVKYSDAHQAITNFMDH